ncbi:MAG TPA: class I SAM-dependent rRNA methyltransferase [Thermodesulfovibrionales bacterium]|nr:class I SAM-dependent rRNA methyltransferase [Thermodesulfovibrionales bacterium]
MEVVRLHRTARILAGHLWVFSNELAASPKRFESGSLVELRDKKDTFLGIGYINPHSLIAVRILTREREEVNADFFRKRILAALEYRRRFVKEENSFRVLFSEGDLLPGLIVDKYDDCLVVQVLTMGIERWSDTLIELLDDILSPSAIVLRNDSTSRLLEGLQQEKRIIKGSLTNLPVVRESSFSFEIDPLSGQKTGFFLDQRENRIAFSKLVKGGEGLDLFCYSGAWSLTLSHKGAHVTGIDESSSAITRAVQNAKRNNLSDRCVFRKADVFDFLKKEVSLKNRYDFIVLDPPAFVKSGSRVKEALRAYRDINANAMRLLREGGMLATSSCSYHIGREAFREMLHSAARDAGIQARLIEIRSQARDHPILLSVPETEYLKCAFLEVLTP